MNDLEPRERALLAIVGAGEGTLTARSIDIRLSQRHAPSGETVLATLKRLQAEGYVHRVVTAGSPHDAWVLTGAAREGGRRSRWSWYTGNRSGSGVTCRISEKAGASALHRRVGLLPEASE
jgi:hypothetical protein